MRRQVECSKKIPNNGQPTELTHHAKAMLKQERLDYITRLFEVQPGNNHIAALVNDALSCLSDEEFALCKALREELNECRQERYLYQHPIPSAREAKIFLERLSLRLSLPSPVHKTAMQAIGSPTLLRRLPQDHEVGPVALKGGHFSWKSCYNINGRWKQS